MKSKVKVMDLAADLEIYFNEFPEWEFEPTEREIITEDSRVFEFILTDGFFDYVIKAHIRVTYRRRFLPPSIYGPGEDKIIDSEVVVVVISGKRKYLESVMALNNVELSQLEKFIKENLKIK